MINRDYYLKELNKCTKCGLCQIECPVFKETFNECDCPKGKILILEGILKGDLKFSEKIINYFEKCQNCDKCKNSCPAGINIPEIFKEVPRQE